MALLLSRFITNSYSQEENQITRDKILQAMDAIEDD
jgi:hypothetical protein